MLVSDDRDTALKRDHSGRPQKRVGWAKVVIGGAEGEKCHNFVDVFYV